MRLACRLAWHRWSPWGAPAEWRGLRYRTLEGIILDSKDTYEVSESRQQRACPDCGRVQRRVVRVGG